MKKILRLFVPREKELHNVLKELASKCHLMSVELEKFIDGYNKIERNSRKSNASIFRSMKIEAEKLHKEAARLVEGSKDPRKGLILELSASMEKSCKLLNAIASRFVAMAIERIDAYTPKMSKLLTQVSLELSECIKHMKSHKALSHCRKVSELEAEMDMLFEESLSELFHFFKNSLDVMKYKEIYELFEECADRIHNSALLVERIEA
jgi:uncharacterized protein Yka (UPF0111/DUF47 family)